MELNWPSKEQIIQTNQQVLNLENEYIFVINNSENDMINLKRLFNEASSINPNHTSENYPAILESLKTDLFKRIIEHEPQAFHAT